MSRLPLALLAVTAIAVACYKDDSGPASPTRKPMAKVLLTDGPFPFDSVQSAQVYIVSIAVSTHPDTGTSADSMHWVTVAAPHRQIDLLTLQQGLTDSLGIGEVTADQYKAVMVTINIDSSAGIRFKNGTQGVVRWYGSGQQSFPTFVDAPVNIPDTGAVIVIDFDVGRSFQYNNWGDGKFDFLPWIRAVNRAATGGIAGVVQHDSSVGGTVGPISDATVSAWGGGPGNWYILSTGKTDATGHYRLAYLLPGTYIVGVDPPFGDTSFTSSLDSNVAVNQGFETTHNVTLSAFRGGIFIQGASSMLNNHTNPLEAIVINAQHQQDTTAAVTWQNLDPAILTLVVDSTRFAHVTSRAVGVGRIVATSGALADTLKITVVADSSAPAPPHP